MANKQNDISFSNDWNDGDSFYAQSDVFHLPRCRCRDRLPEAWGKRWRRL